MRWDLLDKFEELKKGASARALKAFRGDEDFFAEHHPGRPAVPATLLIEMIAQCGGVLYGLGMDFKKEVILAKIGSARFHAEVAPPCRLTIETAIEDESEAGVRIAGRVSSGGRLAAEAEILLVAVESLGGGKKIVFNDGFLKHFDVFNVARASEGAAR
jgi:3-hydroxyacyl-[acyl-carrier-protein] dehydratase